MFSMSIEEQKQAAAHAALAHIQAPCRLGVGSGSTVKHLITLLPQVKNNLASVVASSETTARLLEQNNIRTSTLDSVGDLDLYIDGADEIDDNLQMIKGGGGAHTWEKILACAARRFIAIVDGSKQVKRLGRFPLPIEVIPLARGYVARKLAAMGGTVEWREGTVTDSGNWILDVRGLELTAAAEQERQIQQIVGVVENGLFAVRRADLAIIATPDGITQHGG